MSSIKLELLSEFANLSRLSFRQLLFAVFLLIIVILSAASVQALFTLERLAIQSREAARQAVHLTEASQRLAERTVAMERSARQYLVLDDTVFLDRYLQAGQDARAALRVLTAGNPNLPASAVKEWMVQSEIASKVVNSGKKRSRANDGELARVFIRLPEINDALILESKREIARQNDMLLDELERQRGALATLVGVTVLFSALISLGFSMWLSGPLVRIEAAIERMGENR